MDPQRVTYLDERIEEQKHNPQRRTHTVEFRDQPLHLLVIRADIGFPRYRLTNGRTRRKQEAYLADHPDVSRDLFSDGASEPAQAAQQVILMDMAKDAGLEDLLRAEGQRDPLIVTADGYVVNGNRRLATLRKLATTQWVDLVVLPGDATTRDIAVLEMKLQMAEDGKADYNWVDELLTIANNVDVLRIPKDQVARAMHAYPKTITHKLCMLGLVNLYLEQLGYPGEHYRVEGDEQAFITLEKAHSEITDSVKQANLRTMAFNMISHPKSGSSVHRQIERLVRGLDAAIELLDGWVLAEPPAPTVSTDGLGEGDEADNPLAELDGGTGSSGIFAVPINSETAELVHEAVEVASGLTNEVEATARPLSLSKQAATILHSIQIAADTTNVAAILAQLTTIEERCKDLRAALAKMNGVR